VMAARTARFHERAELDEYLSDQGFHFKSSTP